MGCYFVLLMEQYILIMSYKLRIIVNTKVTDDNKNGDYMVKQFAKDIKFSFDSRF